MQANAFCPSDIVEAKEEAAPRNLNPTWTCTCKIPTLAFQQMNSPHVETESLGFPPGYFSIRSVATGRLLDVFGNDTEDNTPIGLWPAKDQSLVECKF